jgi:3-vinyl bacteriochlorophyllide hydratase
MTYYFWRAALLKQQLDTDTMAYATIGASVVTRGSDSAHPAGSSGRVIKLPILRSQASCYSSQADKRVWPNPAYKAWSPNPDYYHRPLYTPEQRAIRDKTPWTMVQAILAPLQFLIFAVSLGLVARFLATGQGYEIATASIVAKTIILYVIMITGSIWEKVVFGEWLFVESFFWEDVFSMVVLGLQTLYLCSLIFGWWTPRTQMWIAVAAYGTYVINAAQFIWKLRVARLEGAKIAKLAEAPT